MSTQMMEIGDPSSLADSVRRVARDARRLLQSGDPDPATAGTLLRRIDEIRLECGESPSSPISRWLDNLQQKLERV